MAIWNERIRNKRLEKGITLAQVAEALGVTEATAQRYESGGIKSVPYDHMCAYGDILNCSPAYLMGWEPKYDINVKPDLDSNKQFLIEIYHSLPDNSRERLLKYASALAEMHALEKPLNDTNSAFFKLSDNDLDSLKSGKIVTNDQKDKMA